MKYSKCLECGNKTAWYTLGANVALAILMGIAGAVGRSHALVADGLLAAADVIISLVVLAGLRIGEKGPDREHPYGHGKVEFIVGSVVAVVIIFALLFLFKDAVDELNPAPDGRPDAIALVVAVISIFVSEQLFRLNSCAGRELRSPALIANSVYNRFNAYTSGLVAVAIIGAMAGMQYFDPAAIIIVGVVMIKTLIEFLTKAYAGLMDTGFSPAVRQQIVDIVREEKSVEKILFIKARSMGRRFWVNLCVEVSPIFTVSQSFTMSRIIREAILFRIENIEDVHIETRSGSRTQ